MLEIGEDASSLAVSSREFTGVGGYINFSSEDVDLYVDIQVNLFVEIPELDNGFGVVGYRKPTEGQSKGKLASLEFCTFSEEWWLDYSTFEITNLSHNQETLPE